MGKLHISNLPDEFPSMSNPEQEVSINKGDFLYGLALLEKPMGELFSGQTDAELNYKIEENGELIAEIQFKIPVETISGGSPVWSMDIIPNAEEDNAGHDWSGKIAEGLNGLQGSHSLTITLSAPGLADSLASGTFQFNGDAGDYTGFAENIDNKAANREAEDQADLEEANDIDPISDRISDTINIKIQGSSQANKVKITRSDGSTIEASINMNTTSSYQVKEGSELILLTPEFPHDFVKSLHKFSASDDGQTFSLSQYGV